MNPQEWFETGQRLSYPEARKVYYEKGLGETPAYHVWAWIGIGLSLADRGDRVGAQDAFNLALKPDPSNLYALCYLARSLNICADFEEGVKIYERVLVIDPKFLMALADLGWLFAKQNNWDRALPYLNAARAIEPAFKSDLAYVVTFQNVKLEEMRTTDWFDKILESIGSDPAELDGFVQICIITKQFTRAIQACQRVLDKNPKSIVALTNLGLISRAQNNFPHAILHLRKALNVDINYFRAFESLLYTYWMDGKFPQLLEAIQEREGLDPQNPDYWYSMGKVCHTLGDIRSAARYLNKAVQLASNFVNAWITLGITCRSANDLPGAKSAWTMALDINPIVKVLHNRIEEWGWKTRQAGSFIKFCRQRVEANPASAISWNSYGNSLDADPGLRSDPEMLVEIRDAYGRAISIDPTFVAAWINLGDTKHRQDAILDYEQALKIDPEDLFAWFRLGLKYPESNRRLDAYTHLLAIEPRIVQVWNRLGSELETLTRSKEALYCYEQSCKLGDPEGRKWVKILSARVSGSKVPHFFDTK